MDARQIKFRVYDKIEKDFLAFADVEITSWNFLNMNGQSEFVFQQFTGKLDIDDNPIWEGDIVEFVFATQTNKHGNKLDNLPKDCFGVYEIFYSDFNACFMVRCHKRNWFDRNHRSHEEANKLTLDTACPVIAITETTLSNYGVCRVIGTIFDTELT